MQSDLFLQLILFFLNKIFVCAEKPIDVKSRKASPPRAGAPPRLVAFVGKRQYGMLFDSPLKKVPSGVQTVLPPRWPLDPSTEVHVLTSPSGRAAVPPAERLAEYQAVAAALHAIEWPLR